MEYRHQYQTKEIDQVIESLDEMRRFNGPPGEFWPAFLQDSARLAGARLALLLIRAEDGDSWKKLCIWPARGRIGLKAPDLAFRIEEIAEESAEKGSAWEGVARTGSGNADGAVIGIRLDVGEEDRVSVAVFLLDAGSAPAVEETATRLKLVAGIPAAYQMGRVARQARSDVVQFAEALDLMVLLNAEKRYMAAAMTFCNELASRYRCGRVSLGWLEGGYVRVQAISHVEQFKKKMDIVQTLEAAMEEAFDQDEEIVWPPTADSSTIVRDHETFSRESGTKYLVSLPIRVDDAPVAVVTCERADEAFSEREIRGLRLLCDQAARRLADLKRNDRWFGARMATSAKEALSRLVGVEHTLAKCIGILVCVGLSILVFGKWNYRVEAPFILKTDDLAYLPAPFDGYIDRVNVEVGDKVDSGKVLLTLDTRELLLEESKAIANENRYSREAEKARAQNALADMRIARAMADQAKARLALVRYYLSHAELKAPFEGIVVEGDLKELLGAPVKKGDVLFKVARIEKMYAELDVDERDVHEIAAGQDGEIAFVSRPSLKFPIKVERVDPVAVTKEKGNVFATRCFFTGDVADWWRPGMSGVAKIDVGKRNILWILTHRTIDFLRILFWW